MLRHWGVRCQAITVNHLKKKTKTSSNGQENMQRATGSLNAANDNCTDVSFLEDENLSVFVSVHRSFVHGWCHLMIAVTCSITDVLLLVLLVF